MSHFDIIIIGAGPSGTVTAAILKNKGYNVLILEKQKFPRFVIGESLLPRCMDNLELAGFLPAIEKAGFQKKLGAIFRDKDAKCEFDFSIQYTNGWSWTWQVQRGQFDHLLAQEVEKQGAIVNYEATVTDVEFKKTHDVTVSYTDKENNAHQAHAKFIVDASGYGRVLPRLLNLDKPSDFPSRSAIFCHVKPQRIFDEEERKRIIIINHTQGIWAWVIPFSNGTTSIGIVGLPELVGAKTGSNEEKIRSWIEEIPALKERFTDAEILFEPKQVTGYSSSTTSLFGDSFVLTGNSAEFLDPIFSSGITFATESGVKAAHLIDRELNGENVNWQTEYSDYIAIGVDVFRSFIQFWYDGTLQKIFFTKDENTQLKEQICSILAGYVWDISNPLVTKHKRAIPTLAQIVS